MSLTLTILDRGIGRAPRCRRAHQEGKRLLGFPLHFHMLRHSFGFALANAGHDTRGIQDYLGHRAIQHTVRYTELTATKFRDFWR